MEKEYMKKIEKIIKIAKKRGFIFASSEIYGGLSGTYDFGPLGFLLKKKIIEYWREFFIKNEDNIFEIESSLIMPEKVFEASGHLKGFIDPITQCKKCKSLFRADNLIEESVKIFVEGLSKEELTKIIREKNIKCPKCEGELEDVKVFNLMFSMNVGALGDTKGYLRPETAQGIFINFKNILTATRAKLPFGIAQIGKSFRNEISPRQWLIRLREFTQAEIEFFINPEEKIFEKLKDYEDVKIRVLSREAQKAGKQEEEMSVREALERGIIPSEYLAYFIAKEQIFYESLGIPKDAIRFRHLLQEETPHYSKGNVDMEILFDFGWKEVVGNAYRSDYDLKRHAESSKTDLSYVLENGKKIIPHVVEPSFGIERTIYAILLYSFVEDKERGWDWFKFDPKIAPISVAVFPLLNKKEMVEKSIELFKHIKKYFDAIFDKSGSIGKRYARSDEIGIPYAITIDHQTLEDNTVTIRDRNTTKQERVKIEELIDKLNNLLKV
ncbi:MAG: glycine--tRNA ligase [Candidatus Aenigmatarchaeota archaeon]|jgi:glycyl-tRNA synthetase